MKARTEASRITLLVRSDHAGWPRLREKKCETFSMSAKRYHSQWWIIFAHIQENR